MRILSTACGVLAVALTASLGAAAEPLEFGKLVETTIDGGETFDYEITAEAAGLLTVAVYGEGGDLVLRVTDPDNQPLADGEADGDLGGNLAREQLLVSIPHADTWRVRVANIEMEASAIKVVVGFVPFPPVAREPDPDGRPSRATDMEVGETRDEQLSTDEGDLVDWYAVTVEKDGRLVVFTEGDAGLDCGLTAFIDEQLDMPLGESDQDLGGETANEGLIIPVKAGRTYYIKVQLIAEGGGSYKLGSAVVAF